MPQPSKRDHLIETALALFNEHGFHAVGIDTILEEAKVSKKTLYKHFHSKNDLVLAAIRLYDETFRNFLVRELEKKAQSPYDRLLAIFDVAQDWFSATNFHGCLAVKAVGEFSESDRAIQRSCEEFKRLIFEMVESLAIKAGAKQPEVLAHHICLILEGAITLAHVNRKPEIATQAKQMARIFIEDQCAKARRSA